MPFRTKEGAGTSGGRAPKSFAGADDGDEDDAGVVAGAALEEKPRRAEEKEP